MENRVVEFGNGYRYIKASDHMSSLSSSEENYDMYGVLDYENNNNYIIALKVKGGEYDCSGYLSFFYENKLQYIIIDINKAKTMTTENKNQFIHKKKEFGINLDFSLNSREIDKKSISYIYPNHNRKNCIKKIDFSSFTF